MKHESALNVDDSDAVDVILEDDPVNAGLPKLRLDSQPLSYFELWPAWFFYVPVVIYWLYLSVRNLNFSLPMLANPSIELGGMVGESKSAVLKLAGPYARKFILPFIEGQPPLGGGELQFSTLQAHTSAELERANTAGISLPFVIKPDLGCRGVGVKLIETAQQLEQYIGEFPQERTYVIQKLAPYQAEAGVFYQRMPGEEKGKITSVTLKYTPYVTGDGVSSVKDLIESDPRAKKLKRLYIRKNKNRLTYVPSVGEYVTLSFAGSHCRGSIFRNGGNYVSAKLESVIDEILKDFPEFHYGRLDIKFKHLQRLQAGKDFTIIELNGASSEATHIWDSRARLFDAFSTLFAQYRTLFDIGNQMVRRGFTPPSAVKLIKIWIRELLQSSRYPD